MSIYKGDWLGNSCLFWTKEWWISLGNRKAASEKLNKEHCEKCIHRVYRYLGRDCGYLKREKR